MMGRTAVGALALAALLTGCQQSPPGTTGPDLRGVWQSGGTSYKITTDGAKVSGTFEVVIPGAQALGFKSGDFSFEGTQSGNFLRGEQVIRYPSENPCHKPNGRRVPFMGMVSSDGKQLVMDWYNVSVDVKTCQDLGRTIGVTLLERR